MSTKLVITICEMIILTHRNSDFYFKYWWRYSTLKIPHFKGKDNLMIRLISLFPYCAMSGEFVEPTAPTPSLLSIVLKIQF